MSLVCLVLVAGMLLASRLPFVAWAPRRIMVLGMAAVALFDDLEVSFDISDYVVVLLSSAC